MQDDSFLEKFGKLRQLTEGVTVVLLDRCAPTCPAGSAMLTDITSSNCTMYAIRSCRSASLLAWRIC